MALPPACRIFTPAWVASGWPATTMPWRPVTGVTVTGTVAQNPTDTRSVVAKRTDTRKGRIALKLQGAPPNTSPQLPASRDFRPHKHEGRPSRDALHDLTPS